MSKDTKVLLLPEESFKYLLFVYDQHLRAGIPSEEVYAAATLKSFLDKAQVVDFSKLGKAGVEKVGPGGVALNLTPEPPEVPECETCFNDEGSFTCVRPAHKAAKS